jgi:hypothetical protein
VRPAGAQLVAALPATAGAGGGRLLKKERLKPCDATPDIPTLRVYGASDYAVTADGGD